MRCYICLKKVNIGNVDKSKYQYNKALCYNCIGKCNKKCSICNKKLDLSEFKEIDLSTNDSKQIVLSDYCKNCFDKMKFDTDYDHHHHYSFT